MGKKRVIKRWTEKIDKVGFKYRKTLIAKESYMEANKKNKRRMRAKLIFNPHSGINDESPLQLMDVIKEMQAWNIMPEAYLIEPDSDLHEVVRDAIAQGIHMFVVCGGDGTVSAAARALIGTNATLGIIPTGTQNNVAFSLGIPTDIPAAIAILRTGRRYKADIGMVTCGGISTPFIEICSVGMLSTLFPAGDDIQHGNIAKIGDFLATFATFSPSEMHLLIDDKQEIQNMGHVVLITNMPYVIRHYQVGSQDSLNDGLLDVLIFADISKIDLIGYILKGPEISMKEDHRIQHFRVRKVTIDTNPAMSVMADGITLGEGLAEIEVRQHALALMIGPTASDVLNKPGEIHEK